MSRKQHKKKTEPTTHHYNIRSHWLKGYSAATQVELSTKNDATLAHL